MLLTRRSLASLRLPTLHRPSTPPSRPAAAAAWLVALAAALPAPAWALAMSRGVLTLPLTAAQCLDQAIEALVAEGYHAAPLAGTGLVHGFKGLHGAYVICGSGPGGQTEVNVVVATEGSGDDSVSSEERVRLQRRMAGLPAEPAVTAVVATR